MGCAGSKAKFGEEKRKPPTGSEEKKVKRRSEWQASTKEEPKDDPKPE